MWTSLNKKVFLFISIILIIGLTSGILFLVFLNEASKVIPQIDVDNDYKERYSKILETYKPEEVVETAFKFNPWQE